MHAALVLTNDPAMRGKAGFGDIGSYTYMKGLLAMVQ